MKRSEINSYLREGDAFFRHFGICLPPWAHWTLEQWRAQRDQTARIRAVNMGWDVTDFGSGNFSRVGLLLFTIRNGLYGGPTQGVTQNIYAEKIMMVRAAQATPWHFHSHKTEDIINRGGGVLIMRFAHHTATETRGTQPVEICVDGIPRQVEAQAEVEFTPGESVTLVPGIYHTFYGQRGSVLVGEVSSVNDDATDNRFLDPLPRYPKVEEDEAMLWPLCNERP